MRILISNDDGYQAKGIKQLAESLSEIAEIIIVAPNTNKPPCKPIPLLIAPIGNSLTPYGKFIPE